MFRGIKWAIKTTIAHALAWLIPPQVFTDRRFFQLWQSRGYHITPVHFYQPIPDTRTLTDDIWTKPSEMVGVDMNVSRQLEMLSMFCATYKSEYEELKPGRGAGLDWSVLYCMVRHFKPRRMIEIGSGISTCVSAMAIEKNRQVGCTETSLVAIEPYPRQELIDGFAGLSELKRMFVQDVPLQSSRSWKRMISSLLTPHICSRSAATSSMRSWRSFPGFEREWSFTSTTFSSPTNIRAILGWDYRSFGTRRTFSKHSLRLIRPSKCFGRVVTFTTITQVACRRLTVDMTPRSRIPAVCGCGEFDSFRSELVINDRHREPSY